jgi:hypothetical protein
MRAKHPWNCPPPSRVTLGSASVKLVLTKEDVLTVSRALEVALLMDAKLNVSKTGFKSVCLLRSDFTAIED